MGRNKEVNMNNILVGVTGGIAAYKAADVISVLVNEGYNVRVVMTEKAKQFITPLTLATLSKGTVYDDASEWNADGVIKHIELAKWLDVMVVVPATANTIVKMSRGIADNLLTSIYIALPQNKKAILFPAMNTKMWENPHVQDALEHLTVLDGDGILWEEPIEGKLACGDVGIGKLPPTKDIIKAIKDVVHQKTT
jgi:phosphopantothenoylcysteine synthetase/decarboxylase